MGSLTKEYSARKLNGRTYTPPELVARILDAAGYAGPNVVGARLLDPACGDGQFLVEAVRRVVNAAPRRTLQAALQKVYGWDTDADAVAVCRTRLDEIIRPLGIEVNWNVLVRNSLEAFTRNDLFAEREELFDFVVGNPPYVRIQHLDEVSRALVQSRFTFCAAGSTDLYIAFFELALSLLSPEGVVAFITPNTFFHTATGRALRHHLTEHRLLRQIVNFGHRQVFPNVTTYAAITIASKQGADEFEFVDASHGDELCRKIAVRDMAKQDVWRFGGDFGLQEFDAARYKPLKEIARIHVGLATLADSVYVVQGLSETPEAVQSETLQVSSKHFGEWQIERALLRPVIKGSRVKAGQPCFRNEWIIFPYHPTPDGTRLLPEEELAARFPQGYAYLCQARLLLDRRDNGRPNPIGWHGYGRTQALESSFGEKIIFPPLAAQPNFAVCTMAEATVYSGYFIKFDGDLESLAGQLNSPRMQQFMQDGGRDFRGGWKGYSKAALQEFLVDVSQL